MLHVAIFYLLLTGACAYAFACGGAPERWMAAIFLAATAATWAIAIAPRGYARMFVAAEPLVAIVDGTMLLCVVTIALRANRFWPMGMSALLAFGVVGHLAKAIAPDIARPVYLTAHAFSAHPALLLLIVATHRHRARLARTGCDPSWSTSSPWSTAPAPARRPTG
jgi:hypothetical protein